MQYYETGPPQRYKTVPITYKFSMKLPLQFDDQYID